MGFFMNTIMQLSKIDCEERKVLILREICNMIKTGRFLKIKVFATMTEISPRTIQRIVKENFMLTYKELMECYQENAEKNAKK
jgi:hypothetical protein